MSNTDRITKKNLQRWMTEAQKDAARLSRELADAKRRAETVERALDEARAENARLRAAHPRGVRVITADDTFIFPAATDWRWWNGTLTVSAGPERLAQVTADDVRLVAFVNCPPDKESTAAWLTEARIYGLPVTALCGKTWVPERDPKRYPICTACTDAAGIILFEGA